MRKVTVRMVKVAAITLVKIKSVDPACGKNGDKIVSLLLVFLRRLHGGGKKISASSALAITKKLNGKCRELVQLNDSSLQVCWFQVLPLKSARVKHFLLEFDGTMVVN